MFEANCSRQMGQHKKTKQKMYRSHAPGNNTSVLLERVIFPDVGQHVAPPPQQFYHDVISDVIGCSGLRDVIGTQTKILWCTAVFGLKALNQVLKESHAPLGRVFV